MILVITKQRGMIFMIPDEHEEELNISVLICMSSNNNEFFNGFFDLEKLMNEFCWTFQSVILCMFL
jgi:hypothetical protein